MLALLDQTRQPLVPTPSETLIAREALPRLEAIAETGGDIRVRVLESADVVVPLPAVVVKLIVSVLAAVAEGKPVSVIPSDAALTTQQAADLLNVSRPYLFRLIEAGEIPFDRIGAHRRLRVADLLAYREKSLSEREAAIRNMVSLSQDLGLE